MGWLVEAPTQVVAFSVAESCIVSNSIDTGKVSIVMLGRKDGSSDYRA